MTKHMKRYHNGKDRRTGRPIRSKRKGPQPTPQPKCCQNSEQRDAVNRRLLEELNKVRPDRCWDELKGVWVKAIPAWFERRHRRHMRHFRPYAYENSWK